jgi:hypothetical protein
MQFSMDERQKGQKAICLQLSASWFSLRSALKIDFAWSIELKFV